MIEIKRRHSKAERLEAGDGHLMNWVQFIPAAISAAGALYGAYAAKQSQDKATQATEDANQAQLDYLKQYGGVPRWSPQQEPYVFGAGKQIELPQLNPAATDYANMLAGGYNPAYGAVDPTQYLGSPGGVMGGLLGNLGQQNPTAASGGGLLGLLGFGGGTPPPLFLLQQQGAAPGVAQGQGQGQWQQPAQTPLSGRNQVPPQAMPKPVYGPYGGMIGYEAPLGVLNRNGRYYDVSLGRYQPRPSPSPTWLGFDWTSD